MASTLRTIGFGFAGVLCLAAVSACAPVDGAAVDEADEATGEARAVATIAFAANGAAPTVTGRLAGGGRARVRYDAARLAGCRGDAYGRPAWTIVGYYRVGEGEARSFLVAGASPTGGAIPTPEIALPATGGELQVWFHNTSRWGCSAYDSSYGRNYRFAVARDPRAPGWVGNARSAISRATCDHGGPCADALRPLADGFHYDTWARQRALVAGAYFEVWKEGVTDRDNPDLWRQLDVQMHYRYGAAGAFRNRYVSFDARAGNNARYAVRLREVDPFSTARTPTRREECPAVPLAATPDGMYVSTTVEFYFTVNGVELRPSEGAAYRGTFTDYRDRFAVCLAR